MNNDIKNIADHFGIKTQKKKLLEELMELAVADSKSKNNEFINETADVLILIFQRAYQRGIDDEDIEKMIEFKVNRTLKRIKGGYYDKL